jgi:hypothetical protein
MVERHRVVSVGRRVSRLRRVLTSACSARLNRASGGDALSSGDIGHRLPSVCRSVGADRRRRSDARDGAWPGERHAFILSGLGVVGAVVIGGSGGASASSGLVAAGCLLQRRRPAAT